ncbi:MAG: hypothetical protein JRJ80_05450 [Deltaproteobacteria bacterium]|nr:hypothetical protein [Deltaproteobacteria bacterium]
MSDSKKQTESEPASSDRTLPRREWITAFTVGGVVAAGATLGIDSCQTVPRAADSPELELRYIKTAVEPLSKKDYVAEAKRQGLLSEDIHEALTADINEYLSTTYQALVYSELINGLPENLRESDEVQSDIAAMSPVLDQAVADAYFIVGTADDEIRKQIDREVREDPDVLMDMASFLDQGGASHGMGLRGRMRLRRASRQLSSRLRMQSTEEVIADLTDQITRYAERNEARTPSETSFEVSLASRRMLAAYQESTSALERWHPEAFVDPSQAEAEGDEAAEADAESAKQQAQAEEELNRRRRVANLSQKEESLTRASRGLAGAGGALLIAGGIAFGVTGGIGGAVLMCIGGFLLLIALFVVGARARRRTQLEEERARLKSTDGQ